MLQNFTFHFQKKRRKRPIAQCGSAYEEVLVKIKWEEHLLRQRHAEERHAWDLKRHEQEMDHKEKEHEERMKKLKE